MAVEIADAYLMSKANTKHENNKNVTAAENALNPYVDVEADSKMVNHKKDLMMARIKRRRGKYSDAMDLYEAAVKSLDKANDGETNASTAALYAEMGDCAEAAKDKKNAGKLYKKAYDTFLELDMIESAKTLEPKLPTGSEDEDEETCSGPEAEIMRARP